MGELFAILSASLFAVANIAIARGANLQSQDNGAFLSIVMTALIAGAMYAGSGAFQDPPAVTAAGFYWFAAAGLLTAFLGRVFVYASIQHLGAVRASAVKRLNPFFAVLIGVLILGEPLSVSLVIGMGLISFSFVLLIRHSLAAVRKIAPQAARPQRQLWGRARSAFATAGNLGYLYGPVSALSYAIGYVGRKKGLEEMADPFFGTLVGAVVGVVAFLLAALFRDSYRAAVRSSATSFNGWQYAAGIFSSLGQICLFFALMNSTITRVALISSMEVFITMFFSVWMMRAREPLGFPVLSAATLGVVGTAFIVWK